MIGLEFPNQRIGFLDGTFLKIEAVFDEELDPVKYSYHFQHEGGDLIFRKDMHVGHEDEVGGFAHINDKPSDPDVCRPFKVVEPDEVLREVGDFQAGNA